MVWVGAVAGARSLCRPCGTRHSQVRTELACMQAPVLRWCAAPALTACSTLEDASVMWWVCATSWIVAAVHTPLNPK